MVGVRSERALVLASLEEYLPPDHLARFVWRVVEKLDLRDLRATYSRDLGGRPALDPKGMLAVILCGHTVGTASSRGLEQACCDQIRVKPYGSHLLIQLVSEDGEADTVARLTSQGGNAYGAAFRPLSGRWEPLPGAGPLKDMADLVTTLLGPYLQTHELKTLWGC